jgi:hypothetical protein
MVTEIDVECGLQHHDGGGVKKGHMYSACIAAWQGVLHYSPTQNNLKL